MSAALITTLAELEEWCDSVGQTVQATYRVRLSPKWRVAVYVRGHGGTEGVEHSWIAGEGDTLALAVERAFEAYYTAEREAT